MFTVKKLQPETILTSVNLGEKTVGYKTAKKVTWGVVNAVGQIVQSTNGQYEVYPRKDTAQTVADYYNSESEG